MYHGKEELNRVSKSTGFSYDKECFFACFLNFFLNFFRKCCRNGQLFLHETVGESME